MTPLCLCASPVSCRCAEVPDDPPVFKQLVARALTLALNERTKVASDTTMFVDRFGVRGDPSRFAASSRCGPVQPPCAVTGRAHDRGGAM